MEQALYFDNWGAVHVPWVTECSLLKLQELYACLLLSLHCDVHSLSRAPKPSEPVAPPYTASPAFTETSSHQQIKKDICIFKSSTSIYDMKGCIPVTPLWNPPVYHGLSIETFQKQFHQFKEA